MTRPPNPEQPARSGWTGPAGGRWYIEGGEVTFEQFAARVHPRDLDPADEWIARRWHAELDAAGVA